MVAAKSCSEHAVNTFDLRPHHQTANRETVAHSFGYSDQVGSYAGELVCEELTGSSVARLYFVENEKGTGLLTLCSKGNQIRIGRQLYSPNSLDPFNNDSCCFFIDRRQCRQVIHRDECYHVTGVERRN